MVEALLGAFIIGVSALSILELVRSGTQSLEVTEAEAAARQLGADLLRRVVGPRLGPETGITEALRNQLGQPTRWSDLLRAEPALAHDFPTKELQGLLDTADVRLSLEIKDFPHEALGPARVESVEVTVHFTNRNDVARQVKCARLIEK